MLESEYQNVYRRLQKTPFLQRFNPFYEATFDTKFWTGYFREEKWIYSGKTYFGNEINYLGIGMYEAWRGHALEEARRTVKFWKGIMYFEKPNEAVMEWMERGYSKYYEIMKKE